MVKETALITFWRELGGHLPLGIVVRAWRITRNPAQARLLLLPGVLR